MAFIKSVLLVCSPLAFLQAVYMLVLSPLVFYNLLILPFKFFFLFRSSTILFFSLSINHVIFTFFITRLGYLLFNACLCESSIYNCHRLATIDNVSHTYPSDLKTKINIMFLVIFLCFIMNIYTYVCVFRVGYLS